MAPYQVIIVEDDPMVASINRQYLQANCQLQMVGQFQNGRDAISFLQNHPADLAIVDYYMPVMDGRQFILACHREKIPIDIIMITAANSVQEIVGIMQLGMVDYLIKPFTADRFQAAIEKYLRIKRALRPGVQLSQEELDQVMSVQAAQSLGKPLEKGLQEQTLNLIRAYLRDHRNAFLSSNEIAEETGLSRITVRRYMNYLLENHEIVSQIDYGTGGRPSIKYKRW